MSDSGISGLYRLGVTERIAELQRNGWLSEVDAELLRQGRHVILPSRADRMIENVIGVFGLPLGIATNFVVNSRDYIVPMAVEEPSVVAAVSNAARLARSSGGFSAMCNESLLAGQVHITGVSDPEQALERLAEAEEGLLALANAVHPRLIERGGGARQIELRRVELSQADATNSVIAVHILVDTCDAMGANLVNTICESVAPRIAELCGGHIALRILSNLVDRSVVTANVIYKQDDLSTTDFDAATVRDRIVLASDIANADAYRAATHNKGIMNGIDALAIATGNDWRAIEAGAHSFAARSGDYLPLATWSVDDNGNLAGQIQIPLKVGIVGGTVTANSTAKLGLRMTAVESARELAELMAAVGLAQNFAALRALVTSGIQEGHMRLHSRSASAAREEPAEPVYGAKAAGKVILLGEHAVVYGKHALALPIPGAVSASVETCDFESTIDIPEWGISRVIGAGDGVDAAVRLIMRELGIEKSAYAIRVQSALPRAMGLGSSAAFAVAIVRAFDASLQLGLDDKRVNDIAYECEKLAHGTPSGIDNTIATYGVPILFRNAESLQIDTIEFDVPPPVVIACSTTPGLTREQVAGVRARRDKNPAHYDALFDQVDALSQAGATALSNGNYDELGALMNICHGLLNAAQLSTPELESMVSIARAAGAVGAKLTGGGGGGSIIALCPDTAAVVRDALGAAGFRTLEITKQKD